MRTFVAEMASFVQRYDPTPNLTLVEHLSNKKKPKTCIHLHKIQIILCLTSKKTRSLLLFVLIRFFSSHFSLLKNFSASHTEKTLQTNKYWHDRLPKKGKNSRARFVYSPKPKSQAYISNQQPSGIFGNNWPYFIVK